VRRAERISGHDECLHHRFERIESRSAVLQLLQQFLDFCRTLSRIRRNVTAMADIAQARGIALVLCAIPPVGRDADRVARDPAGIRRANDWLRSFARARGLRFVDYPAALADAGGSLREDLSADGVHPNEAGYARMLPLLDSALSPAPSHHAQRAAS